MKWLYFLLALAYLISPYDLLPDFLGLPGRLDDLAVLIYVYIKFFRPQAYKQKEEEEEEEEEEAIEAEFTRVEKPEEKDPFIVLDLSPNATREEIDSKYRNLISKYHPDKVNHLGIELQKVANEKTLEIKSAYEKLSKLKLKD